MNIAAKKHARSQQPALPRIYAAPNAARTNPLRSMMLLTFNEVRPSFFGRPGYESMVSLA
ncbi:hypothetical protein VOM14_01995 [Paraburkholderia sp. MPAMCS5]|uniref:hypothetical protein n=1 Tax=Paraburkholderia sp. MPAMCS5 TaxID=3112563 RepID=UPI002E177C57|nr:hypothetical protein [Paraburkholderia sp. MPAMCS5]